MENKHTPGPWDIHEHGKGHRVYLHISGGQFSDYLCDVGGRTIGEEQANARLIASAPDLLAALEDLICCPAFNGDVFSKDRESHRAWTLARAAIARARGE